jgi:hypothetical protein
VWTGGAIAESGSDPTDAELDGLAAKPGVISYTAARGLGQSPPETGRQPEILRRSCR